MMVDQQFSFADLENLWVQNGGDAISAPIAAAIALAENGGWMNPGRPSASGDYGIWQINKTQWGPGGPGNWLLNNMNLDWSAVTTDANANAKAAVAIWRNAGKSFTDWTTYNDGAYLAHLPGGVAPQIAKAATLDSLGSNQTVKMDSATASYIIWIAAAVVMLALLGVITGTTDVSPRLPKFSLPKSQRRASPEKESEPEPKTPEYKTAGHAASAIEAKRFKAAGERVMPEKASEEEMTKARSERQAMIERRKK